jgi:nucleoside-diphosphate-sugar epimerase
MILVTGGSGFIGSTLANTLATSGEQVRVFDIIDFNGRDSSISYQQGDITNIEDIEKALEGVDTVYHCVALVPLLKAGNKFWEVNVAGTEKLLNACRKRNITHFIHLSSSAVFGIPECPVTKNSPLQPVEIYGRAKLAGENLVKEYMNEGRIASIIRPRTVLGNFRLGIFDILFEWISENRNIYLIGDGNNLFQFLHVDDLVEAMTAASRMKTSGIYNIGDKTFGTLNEDLGTLIKKAGSSSKIRHIPPALTIPALKMLDALKLSPLAPWHYLTYHKPFYFDISDEMQALNWAPKYSNLEMMISSYQWYLENKQNIGKGLGNQSPHHRSPKQGLLKLLKWLS